MIKICKNAKRASMSKHNIHSRRTPKLLFEFLLFLLYFSLASSSGRKRDGLSVGVREVERILPFLEVLGRIVVDAVGVEQSFPDHDVLALDVIRLAVGPSSRLDGPRGAAVAVHDDG